MILPTRHFPTSALVLAAGLLSGCGTLGNGRGWGEDATLFPGFSRLGRAARDAALDPVTWLPAAGALAFAVDDWDEKVSDWAVENHPLFGSGASAANAGDLLLDGLKVWALLTAVATPSGEKADRWIFSKAKGVGVEYGALEITGWATSGLKKATGRRRPDGSNRRSFPSGHASRTFASARLASLNLKVIEMPDALRTTLVGAGYGSAAMTAWSRVEAGAHYPSDVLAGAALGNFLSMFIHRAFLGLPEGDEPAVSVIPGREAMTFCWRCSF